jgi:hypothetical protein
MAYKEGKKEKPPFVHSDSPEPKAEDESKKIPAELLCGICNNLLVDAVVIPCCGNSFCDECKKCFYILLSLAMSICLVVDNPHN